ncbi:MAG: tyrosine-type recombinase/integrase [Candidatus Omnitrophica bacterium]|nr:tyrosine-type recombinase/integrase [Candidatus Omnitrophota bacterium]
MAEQGFRKAKYQISIKKQNLYYSGRTGLGGVSIHTLRHTFANHLVMVGVPLATVGNLLGHSAPSLWITLKTRLISSIFS